VVKPVKDIKGLIKIGNLMLEHVFFKSDQSMNKSANRFVHSNLFLAKIRLKTVERAQLNFTTDFGRTSSRLVEIFPKWPNFTQIGA
jgi:hypothetical protein